MDEEAQCFNNDLELQWKWMVARMGAAGHLKKRRWMRGVGAAAPSVAAGETKQRDKTKWVGVKLGLVLNF